MTERTEQLSFFQREMLGIFNRRVFTVPTGLQTRSCAGLHARGLMEREEAWRVKDTGKVTWGYRTNDAGRAWLDARKAVPQ